MTIINMYCHRYGGQVHHVQPGPHARARDGQVAHGGPEAPEEVGAGRRAITILFCGPL